MTNRKLKGTGQPLRSGQKISYASLEAQREALLKRLESISPKLRGNRGYASARALLGTSYMRANLAARLAVLQTAQFMISVLEMLPPL
jgi:hypothetical protein